MCICIFRHCKCPLGGHTHLIPLKATILAISAYAFDYTLCISLFGLMGAQIYLQVFLMYTLTKSHMSHVFCLQCICALSCFLAVPENVLYICALHGSLCGKPTKMGYVCLCVCYQQPPVCMYLCVCMCIRACMHASV